LKVIDASVETLHSSVAPARIKLAYGDQDIKLIVLLRDPVDRFGFFNIIFFLKLIEPGRITE
jgi:hypothetical protein